MYSNYERTNKTKPNLSQFNTSDILRDHSKGHSSVKDCSGAERSPALNLTVGSHLRVLWAAVDNQSEEAVTPPPTLPGQAMGLKSCHSEENAEQKVSECQRWFLQLLKGKISFGSLKDYLKTLKNYFFIISYLCSNNCKSKFRIVSS